MATPQEQLATIEKYRARIMSTSASSTAKSQALRKLDDDRRRILKMVEAQQKEEASKGAMAEQEEIGMGLGLTPEEYSMGPSGPSVKFATPEQLKTKESAARKKALDDIVSTFSVPVPTSKGYEFQRANIGLLRQGQYDAEKEALKYTVPLIDPKGMTIGKTQEVLVPMKKGTYNRIQKEIQDLYEPVSEQEEVVTEEEVVEQPKGRDSDYYLNKYFSTADELQKAIPDKPGKEDTNWWPDALSF